MFGALTIDKVFENIQTRVVYGKWGQNCFILETHWWINNLVKTIGNIISTRYYGYTS